MEENFVIKAATMIQWEAVLTEDADVNRVIVEYLRPALEDTIAQIDGINPRGYHPRNLDFLSENLELFARAFECAMASFARGQVLKLKDTQSFDALMVKAYEFFVEDEK